MTRSYGLITPVLLARWADEISEVGSTMDTKRTASFAGAAELVEHAKNATQYLKELTAACANGDKRAARRALRQAVGELALARAMLRTGLE
jgi:hypothetical protein